MDKPYLVHEKPYIVLKFISTNADTCMNNIKRNVDATYNHVIKLVKVFEKFGVVKTRKRKGGRVRKVIITDKGSKVLKHLEGVING